MCVGMHADVCVDMCADRFIESVETRVRRQRVIMVWAGCNNGVG